MIESQNKSKQHYDMSSRKLQPLKVGEPVHVQREKNWEPDGAIYRRNRKYLNKTPAQTLSQPESVPKVQQAEPRQTRSQTALSTAPVSQNLFSHKNLKMLQSKSALCILWSGVMEWSLGVES